MKLKTRTWPIGVMGAIRTMANGMKVSTSLAVRRSACTSLPLRDAPAVSIELILLAFDFNLLPFSRLFR